jgi:putative addiction module CopG family antidote
MTITLSPDVESFVNSQVVAGAYPDPDAVLRDAIRALEDRQQHERKLADLRAMIAEADEDFAAGRFREFTKEVAEEIKANARASFVAKPRGE